MVLLLLLAPFLVYPLFLMKASASASSRALRSPDRYVGSCPSATLSSSVRSYISAHTARSGWPPELAILAGTAVAAALGVVIGALAIRSKASTSPTSRLRFADGLLLLPPAPSPRRDGIQAVPRGIFLGIFDLRQTLTMYFVCWRSSGRVLVIYRIIHSPFGRCSRPSGRTNAGRVLATPPSATSSCLRPLRHAAGLAAVPRPSSSSSRR